MRTTIHLPDDLHRRAKRKAAEEGRTLTGLIEEGLRAILDSPAPVPNRRVMPRVSSARGGVRPGIDINDSAALQELDDLDHVEKWRRQW